ncbi:MAG: rhodanese-like domain-containing protein [Planctomycetota bacterium]
MHHHRHFWPIAAAAVVSTLTLVGCTGPKPTNSDDIRPIALGELRRLIAEQAAEPDDDVLFLVDPRRRVQFDAGHLPNAENLFLTDAPPGGGRDPRIDANKHIVVYGDNPGSTPAEAMTKRLISLRYKGVRWFKGGVASWAEAGLPLVTTSQAVVGEDAEGG